MSRATPMPFPFFGLGALAVSLYVTAGGAYLGIVYDWPPFWPSMYTALNLLSVVEATSGKSGFGIVVLIGLLFVVLILVLFIVGVVLMIRWARAVRR